MDQAIYEKLKHTPELVPDEHDGSYELVRSIVAAYRDVDESVLDYHDLNAIYLMCIGTWRHGYGKKQEAIQASHLSATHKKELCDLVDTLKHRAEAGDYSNHGSKIGQQGDLGMFGTGFYSFQNKTDVKSVQAFIRMCVDLLDMTEDEEMFQRVALVFTKSFHGMEAASASVILHCLKPRTFPVLNSNQGNEDIYSALGIQLESRKKLETYVDNCRKIKAFRDGNFSFKNYRIMDMAAWDLTANSIQRIVVQYKASFDKWFPDEMYKWQAVKCFQDHWNLDADNLVKMLQSALARAKKLLDTTYTYPCKTIEIFAEKEPSTVREMFLKLTDSDKSLIDRICEFEKIADALLQRCKTSNTMRQHYQSDRVVCTYLFLLAPEKYYIFRYGKLKEFLAEIHSDICCKMGDKQNIITYMEVADQVRQYIQQDPDLFNMFVSARGEDCYRDEQCHLLADDIIYFGSQLHKEDYWPTLADYDPEISSEQWKELLTNDSVCTRDNREILRHMLQLGGEATCKQLSMQFGNTAAHYNSSMVQLARRVHEETDCPLAQNADGDQKWWPILFVGRSTLKDQPGTYSWKLREELEDALQSLPVKEGNATMRIAKNTILFGPPGTGKTYQTVNYAVAIIEGKTLEEVQAEDHAKVMERYQQYKQDDRIEFTTFHQSFGYEDFIEGIRPKFSEEDSDETDGGDVTYEISDGVFKKFCAKAQSPVVDPLENPYGFSASPTIWKVSLASTGENPVRTYCMEHSCIRIGWDEYGPDITDETDYHVGGKAVLNAFLARMQIGDIILSCYSAHSIDAVGVVTGEPEWHPEFEHYKRLRKVRWLIRGKNIGLEAFHLEKSLTLSTVYRLNTTVADVVEVLSQNGFSKAVPAKNPQEPYVFIIDEINRGNISKIFGELITLIEPSKRLGQPEELQVRLPYSQKLFGIPDNVYLLGTMNTADRSIALLDTALRRRFSFKEMMPDSSVLEGIQVEGISISQLLTTLNRRIEVLFDREHTLGHAFFTPLRQSPTLSTLGAIFRDRIVPLLQEYFYDDYDKVRLILGDKKRPTEQQFFQEVPVDPQALFGTGLDFEIAPAYRINPDAFENAAVYRDL